MILMAVEKIRFVLDNVKSRMIQETDDTMPEYPESPALPERKRVQPSVSIDKGLRRIKPYEEFE
jgi:hypothetical protein